MTKTFEIELANPDIFVVIEADEFASDGTLLELAIEELTRKTKIWKKKMIS
jgi:hypothetical protein